MCYDALFAGCFALLLIWFYLTPSVAAKLKGLFVLFAGYLVKNCASLLDASNISKTGKLIRNVGLDRLNARCGIEPRVIIPSIRHFDIAQEIGSVYCRITLRASFG